MNNTEYKDFSGISPLPGHHTKTYYSDGAEEQAISMASRCDRVISFYGSLIGFKPEVTLLVLAPPDWSRYTDFPVYGMPHYNDAQTLIVASEDNDFWKSFIPPLDLLPPELAGVISKTYSDPNGNLTMRSFFDLLAIHELGHAFHMQGGLTMQRMWMQELFANLFLHTYIAEKEPELLPSLTVFPEMVIASTRKAELNFSTLNDLESNYELIGKQFPNNYGWYQCRWHRAAAHIFDIAGTSAFYNLWKLLRLQKDSLDDASFASHLTSHVHQSVADVMLKWDEN